MSSQARPWTILRVTPNMERKVADETAEHSRERLLTGNLILLMALEANGLDRPAAELVDKIAAALSRKPQPREGCAGPIALPDSERGRSAHDLGRLDKINARLARGYKPIRGKTAEEQREDDLRARDALERELSERLERRQLAAGMAEAEALAAARGEAIEAERNNVRRILDRDPLLSLARAGALTDDQLEAGLAVRELYDLRMGDAASVAFDGMPAGAHDHERFVSNRFARAKTCIPVGQLETAILNGHYRTRDGFLMVLRCWPDLRAAGMEPHISLRVLRDVCSEGKTLTSLGRGRAYDRHRKALCWALDVANEVLDRRTSGRLHA